MKINRDRLIQIIKEELEEYNSPENESVLVQTKIQEQIDELKTTIVKLKMISKGEQTIATSVPHSADTEGNIMDSVQQSINIIEMEIAKLESNLAAERYSYQQYKE
tara:strand:+ start:480 stop:797 length:318 start_codon:yes stop_codon:yes gene_type:complete